MARVRVYTAVLALAAVGSIVPTVWAVDPPDLFLEKLLQYTWVGGTGTKTWQQGSNWTAPVFPGGYPYTMPAYPNEPNRIVDPAETVIQPVFGANFSVPLASNLTVNIADLAPTGSNAAAEDNVYVASLKLGSTTAAVTTNITSTTAETATPRELLVFQNFEITDFETNPGMPVPGPDPDIEPEPIYAFNQARALIWSTGFAGVTNEIRADVRFDDDTIVEGDRGLTIWGDIYEGVVDRNAADGISEGGGAENDPPALSSSLSSHLSGGAILHIRGNIYSGEQDSVLSTPATIEDRAFRLNNDRGVPLPPDPQDPENPAPVARQGDIDFHGKFIGEGDIYLGSPQGNLTPISTIHLRGDNKDFTGRIYHERVNLVLYHDNALGAPTDQVMEDPENPGEFIPNKGDYKSSNPNQGFGFNFISSADNRKISTDMTIAQWQAIKGAETHLGRADIGDHSIEIAGEIKQSNTRGFVNLLPYNFTTSIGKTLEVSGPQYPLNESDPDPFRIYTIDGSGMTLITGGIHNRPPDTVLAFGDGHFRKRGSGTVVIDYDETNVNDTATDYKGYTWVEGGHLRFATNTDLPNPAGSPTPEIISTAGAVGVDTGVLGNTQFLGMLNNKLNPNQAAGVAPFFRQLDGPRAIYETYDHGGLMLATGEYASNLDFSTGDLANAANMSLAARETGSIYTGTITPAADNVYRLGGGTAMLTLSGNNKLTLGRQVLATNGGTVALTGTHDYTGRTVIEGKSAASVTAQAENDGASAEVGDDVADDANVAGFVNTTLRATTLANGGLNSSIGKSSSAASNLLIQAGTLQYAGAATSTDRLFTLGTRGGTLDSSGGGAVNFTNTGALTIDIAEDRPGFMNIGVPGNTNNEVFGVPNFNTGATFGVIEFDTSDLVEGMAINDVIGPPGTGAGTPKQLDDDDSPIHIISVESPHVVRTGETDLEGDEDPEGMPNAPPNPWDGYTGVAIRNIQFGPAPARYLELTGSNTGNNTLNPLVGDASDKGEVIDGFTHGGDGEEGSVGIRKTGTGTWILAAQNTYTGQTQVQGGTLKVTGWTGTGDTVVSGETPLLKGTLMGTGNVKGNLIVEANGVVNPGLSPGLLTVEGDYTQNVGGQLTIEIAGTSVAQYDRLTIDDGEVGGGLAGDYNGNNIIDSSDYTVWRDALTAGSSVLLNDPTPGTVTESDFTYWRDNFGDVPGAGSNTAVATLAGTLFVDLLAFSPSVGNMFTILTASSVVNNGLTLAGESAGFNLVVDSTSVKLHYVGGGGGGSGSATIPEPSSILLGSMALVGLLGITRRRTAVNS